MESSNQGTADETNSRQKILEKETIKKTTAKIRTRKLIEIVKKKMQQKKPPSHTFIKKTARRNSINNISLSYRYTFFQLLDPQKKKKIKTVIKQTEKIYNTRHPCYITLRNFKKPHSNTNVKI